MIHKFTPKCAVAHYSLGIRCKQCGDYKYCEDYYRLNDRHNRETIGDIMVEAQTAIRR